MKNKIFNIAATIAVFVCLSSVTMAQTSIVLTIAGTDYTGASYTARYHVWDNTNGAWYGSTSPYQNPAPGFGVNSAWSWSQTVPADSEPRWIIYAEVKRTGGGQADQTQPGQSKLLTTDEYLAGNVGITVYFR